MDVALLTAADYRELPADEEHLVAALRARGVTVHAAVWDDPREDWSRFRLVVVRTIWDYFLKPAQWLKWLDTVAPGLPLWNPLPLLKWNAHKSYLLDLAQKCVPVTPTVLVRAHERLQLADVAARKGWTEVVVKPAISGGGRLTRHLTHAELSIEGQQHLEAVLAEGDALVQPFLPRLQAEGERSYVFLDGRFSHAVERAPTLGAGGIPDGSAMTPRADEVKVAEQVLRAAPTRTLYARVDLATGPDGTPLLQELEVIEPRLFFGAAPGSAEALADAIVREARAR